MLRNVVIEPEMHQNAFGARMFRPDPLGSLQRNLTYFSHHRFSRLERGRKCDKPWTGKGKVLPCMHAQPRICEIVDFSDPGS